MATQFPEPTIPAGSRTEVFLTYLDYFRGELVRKIQSLPSRELRHSRLRTGWTPLELLKHVRFVEMRWLVWGFEGRDVGDPWADQLDARWHVGENETLGGLVGALQVQATHSRAIIEAHDLADVGQPSDRWDGADPPTLERVLFHLLQEYSRHAGHVDIVVELAGGDIGE